MALRTSFSRRSRSFVTYLDAKTSSSGVVFASNPARALYEELGWSEIGRIPDAVDGEDAVIYWRRVGEPPPA
jgi:hypothetical protein